MRIEQLEERRLLASDFGSLPANRNPMQQFDVNNDGRTSPLDALIIINELNANGPHALDTSSGGIIGDDGVGALSGAGEPDRFLDPNGDGRVTARDALMIFNKLNAAQGEQVQIRVEVTDLDGNPVDSLSPGQEFQLRAYTKDLRLPSDDPQRGVFEVYFDINYDATRSAIDIDGRMIEYLPPYLNVHRAETQFTGTPGLMDDVGATAGGSATGSQELLVFIVPMTATAPGVAFFSLDPEDSLDYEVAVYGSNDAVPDNEILFIADSVTVGTQPSASIEDLTLPEGNVQGNATLTVTLSSPAIVPTTIAFTTAGDTGANPAMAGEDYVATTGTVSFAVGETTQTIDIPILGDLQQEPDETFQVLLSAPVGATITDGEAIVTIQNDDTPPVITINNVNVVEPTAGSIGAVFTVSLSNPVNQPVTVQFATADGTAVAPSDYTTTAGTVTFAPGQTTATISIPVLADAETEGVENFAVVLTAPMGGEFPGGSATLLGMATIVDPTAAKVILRLESRNAAGELQSVFQPGDEIRIRAYLTDATAGDPDNQDGVFQMFHDMVYDTTLTDIISRPITFGPAYPNQQRGDLTMDGLVDEIGATADLAPLGEEETFFWEIAFTATAEGLARFTTDPTELPEDLETLIFGSNEPVDASEIQFGSVDVLIGEGPSISIAGAQVTEGNSGTTPMVFQVALSSAHLLPVTVNFATANGTAVAPGDYQSATGQVTFAPGETTKTITVNVVGDTLLESAETFTVTLSNPVNADIAVGTAIGTILDDEVRSLTINDRVIVEGGAGTFTVTLSSPAANPITVNFATANGTAAAGLDYVAASGTLTFNSGEQTKTIIVQTLPDQIADDGETFTITLSGAVGAVIADGVGVGTISEIALAGLSGFVYIDINGDGQKAAGESGLGGVMIELIGVAAIPGGGSQQVHLFTQTDATGRYIFENLPSGSYSIHEVQPAFFNDGIDTAGAGGVVTANDWMFINFTEGGAAAGFNFGEAGLRPQFLGKRMFLASNITNGGSAMNLSGGDAFFAFDAGFSSIDLQALSNTSQAATISILDFNLNVLATTTPSHAATLSFVGTPMQPYFVRIGGGSSSVNVSSFVLGGPNATGQLTGSGGLAAAGDIFAETDDWLN